MLGSRVRFVIGALLLVLVAAGVAGGVAIRGIESERRARDLILWQGRLGAAAQSQADAIGRWVDARVTTLRALAENAALQIYLAQLTSKSGEITAEQAQRRYLGDLLALEATRGGFADKSDLPSEITNTNRMGHAGLALLDRERKPVLATATMPPIDGALAARLAALPPGRPALLDLFTLADGTVVLGFVQPIYAPASGNGPDALAGYVAGIVPAAGSLFAPLSLAEPHPSTERSALVRQDGADVEYLSPDSASGTALALRLSLATPRLDAAFAVRSPGGFALALDNSGREVLATGRLVPGTPWTVLHTVAASEAFADTDAGARWMAVLLALGAALVAACVIAAWRHGTSHRLAALAGDYKSLADRYEQQSRVLRLVSDGEPQPVLVADRDRRVLFANRAFCESLDIGVEDATGKRLDALIGPAAASELGELIKRCIASGSPERLTRRAGDGGRTIETTATPLPTQPDGVAATLIVAYDLTPALATPEKRTAMLRQLVSTLSAAVDARDPHAKIRSAQVAALSRATAQELGLDEATVAAAELAGQLMNFGKAMVERSLLLREGPLSPDEREAVRRAIQATADIVSAVEFDGPVIAGLHFMAERWDGTGPQGLKGEAIPIVARIITAVNLFAAAATDRADRPGSIEHGLRELQQEAGTRLDRHVAVALAHIVENKGGEALFA